MPIPASGPLAMTDIQTEFGGTNPIGLNEYYAGGGLVPAGTSGTYGAVPSSGALSIQNFYGTSQFVPIYIEDVFSTWVYNGSNSAQTITNGIDLLGKGGLVWLKGRNVGSQYGYGDHELFDSANVGSTRRYLRSDGTDALGTNGSIAATPFTSSGFNLDAGPEINNRAGDTNVSWTFREQPKFFDVVTYTGNGGTLSVSHALASKPGSIIIKKTSGTGDWLVCTRKSDGNIYAMYLNTTAGQFYDGTEGSLWTSSAVSINWINSNVAGGFNDSGATYVMYVLAHNAGGFGLTGTDNVISCGSFPTDGGGNATVNLGYEPQWLLIKRTDVSGASWLIFDNMRGLTVDGNCVALFPNKSDPDTLQSSVPRPNATGFTTNSWSGSATYIYIAIRRGPMEVPTLGTSVFDPVVRTGTGSATTQSTGLNGVDLAFTLPRNAAGNNWSWVDRLRGGIAGLARRVQSNTTTQEFGDGPMSVMANTQNALTYDGGGYNQSGQSYIVECFRRAPGFFDEVCYTGTGVARTVAHNLTVVPELMIVKTRSAENAWAVYAQPLGNTGLAYLNWDFAAATGQTVWNSTTPTASTFSVNATATVVNQSGTTYVAYLFATCPGVSKVGSYTGTAATQTINCGFTGGARFVLIKATSTTGDWYVWDSARGIVAGNDPYLELNTTDAEVTSTDWVDTAASGFELSNAGGNLANSNGVSYIFLAIA